MLVLEQRRKGKRKAPKSQGGEIEEGIVRVRPDDSGPEPLVALYYRHMRKKNILTVKEEQALGKKLSAAREKLETGLSGLIRMLNHPTLTKERALPSMETLKLWIGDPDFPGIRSLLECLERQPRIFSSALRKNIGEGIRGIESVRETLVLCNLRLVISVAKRYLGHGLPFLDLVQEGNIGLIRAAEKFQPEKGCRFSTYATWWIHQRIRRAVIEQGPTIRVPVHRVLAQRKLERINSDLTRELGRKPCPRELTERGGISSEQLETIQTQSQEIIFLQDPIGDDDSEVQDFLPDTSVPSPDSEVERHQFAERISNVLSMLSPQEEQILRLRFGIGHPREYTLEETGTRIGITRERVRQIESRALNRLRGARPESLVG